MKRILFLVLLLSCLAQESFCQDSISVDSPRHPRKKVAVVLSGGGAKGMAHIGVLKVLERAGIPIDIITGTSMGSIVGGMYACGHHAQELDSVVRAQDWTFVLSDREDLSHQSLREREKQNTYMLSRTLRFGKSARGDSGGLVFGKNIMALFDAYTSPYNDSIDFSTLPIPFACVATDMVKYNEVVFRRGVLSQAMRASMAIPGAFAPVRTGKQVLVDGGLSNNFPTDIAKEMGADYIIGVDVQSELKDADGLTSTSSILLQMVDYNCKKKYDENLAITDLHIKVNVKGYSSASFSSSAVDSLIHRGEEAAMKHWDEIVALRERLGITASDVSHRPSPPPVQPTTQARYKIGSLVFENMPKRDQNYIRKKYRLHPGDSIDMERADIITTAIRQDLYYRTAKFRIQNMGDSTGSVVRFTAGPHKNNQLNLAFRFDNEEMVALQANAEFPFRTQVPMDLELTARLGKRSMGRAALSFHPLSFFRPTLSYTFRNTDVNLYEYGDKAYSMNYNQHTLELTLFNFNVRNFNVSIGAQWNYFDYHSLLVDKLPEHQADSDLKDKGYISYEAKVWYDSEDHWYFPTRGARFLAKYAYYTDNFIKLDDKAGMLEYSAMWRMTFPLGHKFSLQPMLYGRVLVYDDVPFVLSNLIGGEWHGHYYEQQLPFAGIAHLEMSWDKFFAVQLQGQYKLTTNNIILLRAAVGQDADEFKDIFKHQTILGGSISYYYNTIFGPLGGSLGYSNLTRKLYYYINLGFVF